MSKKKEKKKEKKTEKKTRGEIERFWIESNMGKIKKIMEADETVTLSEAEEKVLEELRDPDHISHIKRDIENIERILTDYGFKLADLDTTLNTMKRDSKKWGDVVIRNTELIHRNEEAIQKQERRWYLYFFVQLALLILSIITFLK